MSDSDSDQAGVPLIENLSPSPEPQNKRKRTAEDDDETTTTTTTKKPKKKRPKKPKDIDDEALDSELGINRAIGHMDSQLLADHIAQRARRFQPDLTEVEVEDGRISEKYILDTTQWTTPRTTDSLPEFLEQFAAPRRKKRGEKGRTLSVAPPANGSPHTLVVAGAGLRAADLTRVLKVFETKQKEGEKTKKVCAVMKLFAKHIKLKDQVKEVSETRMGMGVGTPQRLIDLLENGALSAKELERIVVDASHIDQKKRGILDMKETVVPLAQLLARPDFKERYGSEQGKIELVFF